MNVRPHELLVVVVIIAGAIAATLAKSTMAAVLSLGVVGYGVATTFLLFGAPDLAMTQFSVETLTVADLRAGVQALQKSRSALTTARPLPRRLHCCRDRDARLADWCCRSRRPRRRRGCGSTSPSSVPTLGHGRNIVNVILVDFRAFDTMGEITVLATAAIGVRALLRLAAAETSRRGIGTGTAADVADLSHRRSPADAAAPALCRLPAAARPQRTWRRICRRPRGGGGIRALRDCVRGRACATGTAGQTADAAWRRPVDRAGQRCARDASWSAVHDGAMGARTRGRSAPLRCSTSACFSSWRVWC